MNFDEYLDNLKQESERGAVPNDEIPIERFIQVADNIIAKIDQSMPKQNSKKELYELSQEFMLLNRFVALFTKVIWNHPAASLYVVYFRFVRYYPRCKDVGRCRKKAIEYLNKMPVVRTRMREVWEKNQVSESRTSETASVVSPDSVNPVQSLTAPVSKNVTPKPQFAPLTAPASAQATAIYPSLSIERQSSQSKEPLLPPIYPTMISSSPFPSRRQSSTSTPKITIPFDLPSTFSTIAKNNTVRGIETCGILLGFQQSSESFLITSVLIPNQVGTYDTCETIGLAEEKILSYALTNDLVCLGWIHTHPTQSCFLSSVDMHTTLSYQRMLSNAVAIVVAPTDRDLPVGVWRLTEFGLLEIGRCKLSGFHDHRDKDSFSVIVDDVVWDPALKVVVVDQRGKD